MDLLARARERILRGQHVEARADLLVARETLGDEAEIELAFLDIRERLAVVGAHAVAQRIAHDAPHGSPLRARAQHVLGLAEGKLRRTEAAVECLLAARESFRALGDEGRLAEVEDTLGSVFAARGRVDQAIHHYALSIVRKSLLGDEYGIALTLGNMGRLHLRAGRDDQARECFELDLAIARRIGDRRGEVRMLEDLGRAASAARDHARAERLLREACALAITRDYRDLEFFARNDLAMVLLESGRTQEAAAELEAARTALGRASGEPYLEAILTASSGRILLATGARGALNVLESAASAFADADLPDQEIETLVHMADALCTRGRRDAAEACLKRALRRARRDGFARHLPGIREQMTRLQVGRGADQEHGRLEAVLAAPHLGQSVAPCDADGYVLLQSLGKGGFGQVFRAYDPERHAVVALKRFQLRSLYDGDTRRQVLASARTELDAASEIDHPGVARVLAVGVDHDGETYVVQEFVEGTTLRASYSRGRRTELAWASRVLRHVALALDELHRNGVVHRDLKPDNIVLRASDGLPVLIDFGIAFVPSKLQHFDDGLVVGTLGYMAPEQSVGDEVGPAADVYALGVVAYEWLAGVPPLKPRGSDWHAAVEDLNRRTPPPLAQHRPDLPPPVAELVDVMLLKEPESRPTAREVARSLEAWHGSADPEQD